MGWFMLALVELFVVLVSPFPQPAQIPLTSSPALYCIDDSPQLGVLRKLAESALLPTVQVINESIKHYWSQY